MEDTVFRTNIRAPTFRNLLVAGRVGLWDFNPSGSAGSDGPL